LGLFSTIYTRACRCVRASIPALFLAVTAAGGLGLTLACTGGGGDNNGGGGTTVTAPAITTQPVSQTVNEGASVSFTVVATGTAPLHYQWKKGATNVGTDSASFTINSVVEGDAGSYTVTVTNSVSNVTSTAATLTVNAASLNLALNKTATASSTENAASAASAVVDGNAGTRWSSAFSDPQWIMVDLGSVLSFNNVVLNWEAACATAYQIQISDNGTDWTTIHTETAGVAGVKSILFGSVNARYVRVYGTVRATVYGYSLFEFEVYSLTQYLITTSAGTHGSISPSGDVAVVSGQNQSFTITPDSGYLVSDVQVDGTSVGAVTSYTFTNVLGNHTIAASFGATGGLVWSDEFDGPSIDSSKWAFDIGNGNSGWGNGEWEYYTSSPDNVAIVDGKLVISEMPDTFGGKSFTSSRLITRGRYSFNRGRFVARIKFPGGNMIWPCFWLLGDRTETWPKCGEIDIAEMFCGATGTGDNTITAAAHWFQDSTDGGGDYGLTKTHTAALSADYHDYELEWTDTTLTAKFDGVEFWSLGISDSNLSELKDFPYNIILNMAVGKPGFAMTAANQATQVPQKMYVDYVRVYSNTTSTVIDKVAEQRSGNLDILADGTTCSSAMVLGTDQNLFLWNNLVDATGTPAAGTASLAYTTSGNQWFGLGFNATNRYNLLNFAGGYLNFSMKTTSLDPIKIGVAGGDNSNAWVNFTNGSDPYGFARDGAWHQISIPMTKFAGADFSDISQYFMFVSNLPEGGLATVGQKWEFDEIYWSENAPENIVKPVGTKFGLFTDAACDAGSFAAGGVDGDIFVWNTANNTILTGTPFEGANSYAFSAPNAAWYGMGFTPTKLYDLSAFAAGHLHLRLKVPASSTSSFKIGLKSPGGQTVRESWINFKNGSDPYGFVRDGAYHEVVIPAGDFCNSDLGAIAQLLMIAGDGPATMEFDDVYWSSN
jgi:beta-glucanase (GH16 family)